MKDYDLMAQTVGGIPSLRWGDNVVQGAVVLGCTVIGGIAGLIYAEWGGAFVGAAAAMLGSTLVSGIVLMVIGWVRAARRV